MYIVIEAITFSCEYSVFPPQELPQSWPELYWGSHDRWEDLYTWISPIGIQVGILHQNWWQIKQQISVLQS